MANMKKPKRAKGGPPKKIGHDFGSPGGPHTPGAKKERARKERARKAKRGR